MGGAAEVVPLVVSDALQRLAVLCGVMGALGCLLVASWCLKTFT